jgi:signal transduction histidine kinase
MNSIGNKAYWVFSVVEQVIGMDTRNLTQPDGRNRTILIVDDTPANLETLYSYFGNSGFEIMMAQSGAGALRRVEYARPDVILLDVVMPGMDGYEACRRLKANETTRHIPIIFMTALTDTAHKVKGFEVGAADYITKPFQIEEVLARVQTQLALYDLRMQLEQQNKRLQDEVQEKQAFAAALQQAKDELELRVAQRTAELAQANQHLQAEVAERRQAEAESRKLAAELAQSVAMRTGALEALYEVTALAGESALELDVVLARALRSVVAFTQSPQGTIHLTGEGTALAAQVGFAEPEEAHCFGDAAAAWVIEHDALLLEGDDPRPFPTATPLPEGYAGVPIRADGQVLGVLGIKRPFAPSQLGNQLALLTAVADHIGIVLESIRLRRKAEQAATLEERNRLARELHDSVTQLMYSINLFAKAGKDAYRLNNPAQGDKYLTRLQDSARQALKELRLLLFELRPPQLEQEGLIGALQLRLDAVEGRAGVKTQLLVNTEAEIPQVCAEELYAIAQEALNNALKHSHANTVTIHLQTNAQGLELTITDDGIGFDPHDYKTRRGGMGLTSMRERALKLGGDLLITSKTEQGTNIQLRLTTPELSKENVR